jgi:hypothetical protein
VLATIIVVAFSRLREYRADAGAAGLVGSTRTDRIRSAWALASSVHPEMSMQTFRVISILGCVALLLACPKDGESVDAGPLREALLLPT